MPTETIKELNNLYLLYGEEEYLLERTVKKIEKAFGPLVLGINYIKIDETNLTTLIPNIETPAFGYEKKLIIVKESGLFKKTAKSNNETANQIASYIENNINMIREAVTIIFIEKEVNKNILEKTIEKYGVTHEFTYLTPNEAMQNIQAICKQYEVNIDNATTLYFIKTCGTNMQNLINEIRKLIEYVGPDGEITKETIELLSIKELDAIIFDLTDNLGKKDIQKSLEVLKELMYNGEPIQKILIMLYGHFKKLYITMIAIKNNKSITESLNLTANQRFLTTKYQKQAQYFKENELRKILDELVNLDYKSKQGMIDVEIGLISILCTYCGK